MDDKPICCGYCRQEIAAGTTFWYRDDPTCKYSNYKFACEQCLLTHVAYERSMQVVGP